MVRQYTKKPVQIDALQFRLDNVQEVLDFIGESAVLEGDLNPTDHSQTIIIIETLEGSMTAIPSDYIIKGVKGEFYPCKEGIFLATYDPV
jgi:hypothetical protein